MSPRISAPCFVVFHLMFSLFTTSEAWLGVNYGGTGLSSKPLELSKAVSIIRAQGITGVKIFGGNPQLHTALKGPDFDVMTGIPNNLVELFSNSPKEAQKWVDENIVPFYPSTNFVAIAVGNELFQEFNGGIYNKFIVNAMNNVYMALQKKNLHTKIKVVSPQHNGIVQNSYPPSNTEFRNDIKVVMKDMLNFLQKTGSYLVFNNYGFFAVLGDNRVGLDFVLFQSQGGFTDNGLVYKNIFDAQYDGLVWAMEKVGVKNLPITIGEAGWPTSGVPIATIENAKIYNENLLKKVLSKNGTPKRPGVAIPTYLFEMFDEDLKPNLPGSSDGFEKHWGLFTMQGVQKYKTVFPLKPPASNTWCIASSSYFTNENSIANALSWACGAGKVDCAPIQAGASCYSNGNLLYLAAYAFHTYFQNNNQAQGTCDFGGVAAITTIEPYIGACKLYSGNGKWCVPRNLLLSDALTYACGPGGANCDAIKPGKSCFEPNTMLSHASYAFNSYYQIQGRKDGTCYFNGIGTIVNSNPSYSNCIFPAR